MIERAVRACAVCPRLCRPMCPVAVGSAREAAVPAAIAGVLLDHAAGRVSDRLAAEAAALCVNCGACEAHCHLDLPLPKVLAAARRQLERAMPRPVAAPDPLEPIEGTGTWCVIETDDRPLGAALARRLGAVRRWRTRDALGAANVERVSFAAHAGAIRRQAAGVDLVVAHGGVAEALTAAGVPFRWVSEVVPGLVGVGSCRVAGGPAPLACCGGAGPLVDQFPDDARRVATIWRRRAEGAAPNLDARCGDHLRAAGFDARDVVDVLVAP